MHALDVVSFACNTAVNYYNRKFSRNYNNLTAPMAQPIDFLATPRLRNACRNYRKIVARRSRAKDDFLLCCCGSSRD